MNSRIIETNKAGLHMSFTPNDLLKIYVPFACRTDAAKHVAVSHLGRDARLVLTDAGEHSGDDVVGSCGAGKVIRR